MTIVPKATLVGLDFGTTTSSCLVGDAEVRRGAASGRMELASLVERFRSPLEPTPIRGDRLDVAAAEGMLDRWLASAAVDPATLVGGGALLTGLTASRQDAPRLVAAIRARLTGALVATADDPRLESWLAFQGACAALSRRHPERWFVHVDVGGGTANLALGRAGEVRATGSLFVGARHVRLAPGTRLIESISDQGGALLDELGVRARVGERLAEGDVARVVAWQADLLDAAIAGRPLPSDPVTTRHVQVPFEPGVTAGELAEAAVTISGGVGELVHAAVAGNDLPGTSAFGDLGVDLARALLSHPRLGPQWGRFPIAAGGRATCLGLLRHTVRLSGTSLHLPRPGMLPLADLPIVGTFTPADDDGALTHLLDLARRSPSGAGVRLEGLAPTAAAVRAIGERIGRVLESLSWPHDLPLVLLLDSDCGKALGACVTRFGALDLPIVAIDALDLPHAAFAAIGAAVDGAVPVSFHGLRGG